jgi:uncharacterized phiE125 gp8 family phage protein
MRLTRTSKSTTLPVSVDALKRHLNIDYARDDDYLTLCINTADEWIERETDRAFVEQVWVMTQAEFCTRIYIPKPPLVTLDSIQYYDSDNALQTVSGDDYYTVLSDNEQSYVETVDAWPSTYVRPDSVQITFTCGSTDYQVYAHAVKLIAGAFYDGDMGAVPESLQPTVKKLIGFLKQGRYV